jgi:hypothetical protein
MTTGRRFDLFKKTMDSFLSNCLDRDLIKEWIISDDGSSAKDIRAMKRLYPFIKIYKNKKSGQASNLNNLFSKVKTKWFFHCEDDWLFIRRGHFVREMLNIALYDPMIRNVTLRYWKGELVNNGRHRYHLHRYQPWIYDKEFVKNTNCCWYGYTLNPGLQHLPTVKRLGKYDESFNIHSRFFDRPQAIRYGTYGYKRVNLTAEYIKHIGDNNSAYLNDG